MIFFSQNKPPLLFSEGVILNLVGYCGVFLARGFAGFSPTGAAAGFGAAALRGFLTGAGSGEISTATGGVVSAAGG
jgi:hypothetical protein